MRHFEEVDTAVLLEHLGKQMRSEDDLTRRCYVAEREVIGQNWIAPKLQLRTTQKMVRSLRKELRERGWTP